MNPSISLNKRVTAELAAYAVSQLFPDVVFVGGGVNQIGFFYDFIFSQQLPPDALSLIEVELRKTLKEDLPLRFAHMMRENAESFFLHRNQPFLAEKAAIESSNILEILQVGSFSGLCPNFDATSTGQVTPCVKILELQNKELELEGNCYAVTRLVGNCFHHSQELKQFSKHYEKYRKKNNHLILGKELNLFFEDRQVSEAEFIWMPKGEQLRQTLIDWVKPYYASKNAHKVSTPLMIKQTNFKKNNDKRLSFEFLERNYFAFSSRLLGHAKILQTQLHAKKSMPLSVYEYGLVYKKQEEADLDGLLCSPFALTDQMTICCKKEEATKEIISFLLFIEQIIKIFSFEAQWCLISSLKKGSKAKAEKEAIEVLLEAVQSCDHPFNDERIEEEGLEGPRLELRIVDKLQRKWSCSTITIIVHEIKILDFLKDQVKNRDSAAEVPFLMTQSIWGSLDCFIALLLEHYEGELPMWLTAEQVRVLMVSKSAEAFCQHILEMCREKGFRITADSREIKLSEKVHETNREKIPITVVIGENEMNKKSLTVQNVHQSGKSQFLTLDQFLNRELCEIKYPILK